MPRLQPPRPLTSPRRETARVAEPMARPAPAAPALKRGAVAPSPLDAALARAVLQRDPTKQLSEEDVEELIGFPLSDELRAIYHRHQRTIGYGKTPKGSDIRFQDEAPVITISPPREPWFASCRAWKENRIDAALRRANIVHELTHAAVVQSNFGPRFAGVGRLEGSEAGLQQAMTPGGFSVDELQRRAVELDDVLREEKEVFESLRHKLPGVGRDVDNGYQFVGNRLFYASTRPWEFPTVMNELYYFLGALGDPFDETRTFVKVKQLAEEQHAARARLRERTEALV